MLEIRHIHRTDTETIRRAYDQLYDNRHLMMRDSFYLWLISLLNPKPGSTLLDISCGEGRLVQLAARKQLHAIGVDLSLGGLTRGAQSGLSQTHWVAGNGEALPVPDASVDYVSHIGSLEHYGNPIQGAAEIARVLSATGRACILLPNVFGVTGNIRHVARTGEVFDDGQPLQRYGTRGTWKTLLEKGGLAVERTVPYMEVNWPRTGVDYVWMLTRPQKWLRAALAWVTPLNLCNHFVFLCRRSASTDSTDAYPMLPRFDS